MKKQWLRTALAWLVILLATFFFGRALVRNWANLQTIDFSVNIYSFIGLVMLVVAVLYSGLLWGAILKKLNIVISKKEALAVHTSSWLLKYIPGQAGSYVNKVAWGTKNGHSKKVLSISFMYENIFLLLASLLLSLPVIGLFFNDVSNNMSMFTPLLLCLLAIPLLSKRAFYKIFNTVLKKVRNQTIGQEYFFDSKTLIIFVVKFLIPRIITAVAFVFIAASILSVTPDMYIGLGSIYTLAGIIGIMAIFVPSGLGVREAVIVAFASNYFSTEEAIALALLARLYATVADGILAIIYLILKTKGVSK